MLVAYLYNDPTQDPAGLAEDSDPERSPVVAALRRLGHDVSPLACTLDLAAVREWIEDVQPDVVFNRVESLGGSDALATAVPLMLDVLRLPYTGCPTGPLLAAADKVAVKRRLLAAGLPTPMWLESEVVWKEHGRGSGKQRARGGTSEPQSNVRSVSSIRYILKPIFEHASFGMSDDSIVIPENHDDLVDMIEECEAHWGRPYFAEQYIPGREFNLSLLGGGPTVLPPAEIDFSAFPDGKPQIVGQRAKFDAGSFEFHNTPRRFNFPTSDEPLIRRLTELAVECWRLFGLHGYARVDFRVDEAGRPWILEINANPCLAPDSGFAAALHRAGIGYDGGIERILYDAIARARPRGLHSRVIG